MELQSHFIALAGLILVLVLWYYHHRRLKNLTHKSKGMRHRGLKNLTHKSKGMSPPEPGSTWPIIGHLLLLREKVPVYQTMVQSHGIDRVSADTKNKMIKTFKNY